MSTFKKMLLTAVFMLVLPAVCLAVPGVINYQGRLTDTAGQPVNGDNPIVFSMYTTATGGGSVWSEGLTVDVTDGSFSVELGLTNPIPDTLFSDDGVYLGVKVGTDSEMTPRQRLTSSGYSFRAVSAESADSALNAAEATHALTAGSATSAVNATNATNAANADTVDGKHSTDLVLSANHTKTAHDAMGLDADLVDGQHAADIIDAAADEVRIPISSVPVTITASGSYYFTGDLTSASELDAITINADNVTIDMMGYTLMGPGRSTPGDYNFGIHMNGRRNVEIRNGTIADFGNEGIYEENATGRSHRVINMRIINNGSTGIALKSQSNLVKDCTAYYNGGHGIYADMGSTVTGNVTNNNTAYGISVWDGSTVTGNTVYTNGTVGISTQKGCTVTGNTVYDNGSGISVTYSCTVAGNTVYLNNYNGIYADGSSSITGNTVNANNSSNTTNKGGIYVWNRCYVKNNNMDANKYCNIYVLGVSNDIEENLINGSIAASYYGIYFNNGSNFYANNRAINNTAGNYYGTLPTGSLDGGGNASF